MDLLTIIKDDVIADDISCLQVIGAIHSIPRYEGSVKKYLTEIQE